MRVTTPRLVIAGLAGDSGKTLVSLGLTRALRSRGLAVAPFKKGPDYIDAAWLARAAGRPGRNLDTFLMEPGAIGEAISRAAGADLAVVEGNRGLYDGVDAAGTHSTAELAKLLAAPVVLVVDVTKMTATTAALVKGCQLLDESVPLAGVVLNRVATSRQERVIREAIAAAGTLPVLGAVPKLRGDLLPGRHLGLVTATEHEAADEAIERAAKAVEEHLDLDGLLSLSRAAEAVEFPVWSSVSRQSGVRIAVFRDKAFSFYYPENLEALEAVGAELVSVSAFEDTSLPDDVHGLYVGGGFPEVYAPRLADNAWLRSSVRQAAEQGLPIYAECGGLMYLAREIVADGTGYPMTGVLDIVVEQTPRPVGHGYVVARVDRDNPFFERGEVLKGHEFHYSRVIEGASETDTVLTLERGNGLGEQRDGLVKGRVWASYLHLHALGTPAWAAAFVDLAEAFQSACGRVEAWV